MYGLNLATLCLFVSSIISNFWSQKLNLLELEGTKYMGAKLKLTEDERMANETVMRLKLRDLDECKSVSSDFPPANHFFHSRLTIERSELFDLIRLLPKGCLLHGHDFALASYDYLYSLTFKRNLYTCLEGNDYRLRFFKKPFGIKGCRWMLLSEMRKNNVSFDFWLQSKLSFVVDNPYNYYPNAVVASQKLDEIFAYVEPMLTFKDVLEEYFYKVLEYHYNDNVMYIEFRSYLPYVYDLNGKKYGPVETITIYKDVLKAFTRRYGDFQGAKLIYAPSSKNANHTTVEEYVRVYKRIKMAHPDFVVGFDLIGTDNFGIPLNELINILPNDNIYYFNGAEANWYGSADSDAIEKVLLGTKRIGHGYSLLKHPQIMKIVKDRGVAIEVCPISSQVFHMVADLRTHPAGLLVAQGYPIVVGSDYPAFWGATGLSYDWYLAFVAFTHKTTDLRFLKQLALNSYRYNSMDEKTRTKAIRLWEKRWKSFIEEVYRRYSSGFVWKLFRLFFSYRTRNDNIK